MKNNKKGFTLVELLAVIVILALIMGIAVVGIGSVLSTSRTRVMYENALSIIDGVKKHIALKGEFPNGKTYGFDETLLESGNTESPMGGSFIFRTKETADKEITNGLWQITGTAPTTCSATTEAYISVDSSGVYTICLAAGTGNSYIFGTEKDLNSEKGILPTPSS